MLISHSRNCRYLTRSYAVAFPVIVLICLLVPHLVQAAAGDLDSSFGVGGQVTTDLKRSTDLANAVTTQADGKLVVVGQTYQNNDFSGEDFVVARYNPDGTLDRYALGVSARQFSDGGYVLGGGILGCGGSYMQHALLE